MLFCSIKGANRGYIQVLLATSRNRIYFRRRSNVIIPYKRKKKQPLSKEEKLHNKQLASIRVRIEHKIRQIKTFKIMSDVYRNFQKKYGLRFNIIAGLVNFKCGF